MNKRNNLDMLFPWHKHAFNSQWVNRDVNPPTLIPARAQRLKTQKPSAEHPNPADILWQLPRWLVIFYIFLENQAIAKKRDEEIKNAPPRT